MTHCIIETKNVLTKGSGGTLRLHLFFFLTQRDGYGWGNRWHPRPAFYETMRRAHHQIDRHDPVRDGDRGVGARVHVAGQVHGVA